MINYMANIPSRGRLLELYNAINPDLKVSRDDIVKIAVELNKENPGRFRQQDINNLLYQNRGFMIPYKYGYLRSDSSLLLKDNTIPVFQANEPDLDGMKLFENLENVRIQYKELQKQNLRDRDEKNKIEQRLSQNQEKEKAFKDILESANELARRAAA